MSITYPWPYDTGSGTIASSSYPVPIPCNDCAKKLKIIEDLISLLKDKKE